MLSPLTSCLAFDTATEHLSIALQVHGRVWSHEGPGGAQASVTLIPAILDLLAQAGVALRDLDAIAFGRGPGAFTGLRTACSVAQGLAFGADLPVLPIDTLLAVAEDARRMRGAPPIDDVWVAMDARMGEIYAAHALFGDGAWRFRFLQPDLWRSLRRRMDAAAHGRSLPWRCCRLSCCIASSLRQPIPSLLGYEQPPPRRVPCSAVLCCAARAAY